MRSHRHASVAIVSKAAAPLAILFLMGASACSAQSGATGEEVSSASADLDVTRFGGWQQIPGRTFDFAPAVTLLGTTTNVYGVGSDGSADRMWTNRATTIGGIWAGWTQLTNGSFTSAPAAALWNKAGEAALSESVVIGRGTTNGMYIDWTTGGTFAGSSFFEIPAFGPGSNGQAISWSTAAGVGAGVTFAVQGFTPTLYVVGLDSNNNIEIAQRDVTNGLSTGNGKWIFNAITEPLDPNAPNTVPQGQPALTTFGSSLYLVTEGTDIQYYLNTSADGVNWGAWTPLTPGVFASSPTVASHGPHVEIAGLGTGTRNHMWVSTLNVSPFQQIDTLGTFLPGNQPVSAAVPTGTAGAYEILARGGDSTYYINIWQ